MNPDLHQACIVLFGPEGADPRFLHNLSVERLRRVYRQRVKQCHPDRAHAMGRRAATLTLEFKRVAHSYQSLLAWLARPKRQHRQAPAQRRRSARSWRRATAPNAERARQAHQETKTDSHSASGRQPKAEAARHRRPGQLPNRRLFLAEYLYHRGLVSYQQLIAALVWQRRQRPLFGQLAVEWGYLSKELVQQVISAQQAGERFGDCARRLGLLSIFQHYALIGKQRSMQQPIGQWFIQHDVCTEAQIDTSVEQLKEHNRHVLLGSWR